MNLRHIGNYLHSIQTVLGTVSDLEMIQNTQEDIVVYIKCEKDIW